MSVAKFLQICIDDSGQGVDVARQVLVQAFGLCKEEVGKGLLYLLLVLCSVQSVPIVMATLGFSFPCSFKVSPALFRLKGNLTVSFTH